MGIRERLLMTAVISTSGRRGINGVSGNPMVRVLKHMLMEVSMLGSGSTVRKMAMGLLHGAMGISTLVNSRKV